MKRKQKKTTTESKKRQLLNLFHQSVEFLQIFGHQDLDWLQERIHILVVAKGQYLAKEKECIDYLGVIAEGRALGRGKSYQVGDLIGHKALLGYAQNHSENIVADADAVVVAIRLVDILSMDKIQIKNKIMMKAAQMYASSVMKREEISRSLSQLQILEEKKVQRYLSKEWTSMIADLDIRDKRLFSAYFPYYSLRQKDVIYNATSKPSLIYVVHGQLVAKKSGSSKVIDAGSVYNQEGFIFNSGSGQNVYCMSNEAIVVVIDRNILNRMFRMDTVKVITNLALQKIMSDYGVSLNNTPEEAAKQATDWSIFKKFDVLPLNKRPEVKKPVKTSKTAKTQSKDISVYQTLFREQLGGNEGKTKTGASVESGYDRLYSLKTESQGKQIQSLLELQKLRKEVELLSDKLHLTEDTLIGVKLQLIENRTRVDMSAVHKQIRERYSEEEGFQGVVSKEVSSGNEGMVTLKQALDEQLRTNKIKMLVAKCAYHWLHITRKRKGTRKPQ